MDGLLGLQLVSKVCTELDNHLGLSDKTLAEFIIHLEEGTTSCAAFEAKLKANGAEFPSALAQSLFRLIQQMKPAKVGPGNGKDSGPASALGPSGPAVPRDQRDVEFPGLAMRNASAIPLEEALAKGGGRDGRKRSRSPDKRSSSPNRPTVAKRDPNAGPELYGIYSGKVTKIMNFGVFVELEGVGGGQRELKEGLVHVSHIRSGMVSDPGKEVTRNQSVKVKVISITGSKMSLSMKEADQKTGADLMPARSKQGLAKVADDLKRTAEGPKSTTEINRGLNLGTLRERMEEEDSKAPQGKRLSEAELWEARQLIASGVLPVTEYPTFDAEGGTGMAGAFEETEEELDIELNDAEPAFLRGQTRTTKELSPVKIVANPDGSLNRAALTQGQLAKERRELKQVQANALIDSIPKDLNKPWEDPMPDAGERHFPRNCGPSTSARAMKCPSGSSCRKRKASRLGTSQSRA